MKYKMILIGILAGAVTGIFGSGGGLIVIPLLGILCKSEAPDVFSASLTITLPLCVVVLLYSSLWMPIPYTQSFPYLIGGITGGICAAHFRQYIPTILLHRVFGILLLWGGIRFLLF